MKYQITMGWKKNKRHVEADSIDEAINVFKQTNIGNKYIIYRMQGMHPPEVRYYECYDTHGSYLGKITVTVKRMTVKYSRINKTTKQAIIDEWNNDPTLAYQTIADKLRVKYKAVAYTVLKYRKQHEDFIYRGRPSK